MTEHFTRNTVSASFWCWKCKKFTQHRIDDGRKGPCLECMIRAEAARMGLPVKMVGGELAIQAHDATFDLLCARLAGKDLSYRAPLLCSCPQRSYPHELSVHADLRSEWFPYRRSPRWPWSLMLSVREEPSTERKVAA